MRLTSTKTNCAFPNRLQELAKKSDRIASLTRKLKTAAIEQPYRDGSEDEGARAIAMTMPRSGLPVIKVRSLTTLAYLSS